MNRKQELENLIIKCCESSSIYYNGRFQSVKYVRQKGIIVFVGQDRKLDLCEVHIPEYDARSDEPLLEEIMEDGGRIIGCESHYFMDSYCLTFSLMEDRVKSVETEDKSIDKLKEKICELLRIVDELEQDSDGRKFTLDGHLLGSIGEAFAKYYYGIKLAEASKKLHDGIVSERNVQIKITQGNSVDIRGIPDYLIVLFLKKDTQEVYEVYNGPGKLALRDSKTNGNNVYQKRLNMLRAQDDLVDETERIKAIHSIKKWKKGITNKK